MAPSLTVSTSMASPLGDRTNKLASSQLPVPAVYKQQPNDSSSGRHYGPGSLQHAAYAVPAGMEAGANGSGDEGQQEALSHIRQQHERGYAPQDVFRIHADTEAADPIAVEHEAKVETGIDAAVQFLSVSDSGLEHGIQEGRLGHSDPGRHHCSSAVHEPVFSIIAGSTSNIRHATDTVSPARRVFAAQVTVTRPTTPASPASAFQ